MPTFFIKSPNLKTYWVGPPNTQIQKMAQVQANSGYVAVEQYAKSLAREFVAGENVTVDLVNADGKRWEFEVRAEIIFSSSMIRRKE